MAVDALLVAYNDANKFNLQLDFLDVLAIIGFALQLFNTQENINQSTNDDIMEELQKQDSEFLKDIKIKQDKILSLLEKIQTN